MPNDTIPAQIDREALTLAAYDSEHVRARLIARALVAAERRGLERAAKATCSGCADGLPYKDGQHSGRGNPFPCHAAAIRKLMESGDEA